MIDWLQGYIVEIEPTHLILNVNGVGYAVEIPISTYEKISDKKEIVQLYIETIVRENEIKLFGFLGKKEKQFFKHIIAISGIGPKVAIAMLSTYSVEELIQIISAKNLKALTKVPGIGKKTAERILFELKEKFKQQEEFSEASRTIELEYQVQNSGVVEETILALMALGYRQNEAQKTVHQTMAKLNQDHLTVEILLKACLKEIR
jgi:Holliday junction DNA helicase RuvA